METYVYRPKGVCSREMRFEMDGDVIRKVTIVGGCPGNLLGISRMLENKHIDEVVDAFAGVRCGGKARDGRGDIWFQKSAASAVAI